MKPKSPRGRRREVGVDGLGARSESATSPKLSHVGVGISSSNEIGSGIVGAASKSGLDSSSPSLPDRETSVRSYLDTSFPRTAAERIGPYR